MKVYPNPFNSTLTINYTLPQTSDVDIKIFDALGRQIWVDKINGQTAGIHTLTWHGTSAFNRNSGSGFYIVRIEAGQYKNSLKVMLIK